MTLSGKNAWETGRKCVKKRRSEERWRASPDLDIGEPDKEVRAMPDNRDMIPQNDSASNSPDMGKSQQPRIVSVPRERDEQLLDWLHLYERCGWAFVDIARHYGKNRGAVAREVKAILAEVPA